MKIIIANWKANPTTLDEAIELFNAEVTAAQKYPSVQTVICPPFVYLEELSKQAISSKLISSKQEVSLGSQDVFWENPPAGGGPFTGEISTEMLKNFGVTHVLVGHSDRRYVLGETDEIINKKVKAALEAGIIPILLVGERNKGDDRKAVLEEQLSKDLADLATSQVGNILIAYEPVWAVSTSPNAQPDTPENTLEAIGFINNFLAINYKLEAISCLYGGSVTEQNVADFLKYPEIGGAVIGGASLRKKEFANILNIVSGL